MANWDSYPRASRVSGFAMMPALLMRICNGLPVSTNFAANASIEAGFSKSSGSIVTFAIPSSAACAFLSVRAGTITCAPALASLTAVSRPIPS